MDHEDWPQDGRAQKTGRAQDRAVRVLACRHACSWPAGERSDTEIDRANVIVLTELHCRCCLMQMLLYNELLMGPQSSDMRIFELL